MMTENLPGRPKLWITYPWVDRPDGEFSQISLQLNSVGLDSTYDSFNLMPGKPLWERIGRKILYDDFDGWAYLLTPQSLARQYFKEELPRILDWVFKEKGADFPLISLLKGVGPQQLPPSLRLRPSIHLADPEWKARILALMKRRPPKAECEPKTQFLWEVHPTYGNDSSRTAVEVRPRYDGVLYWRFAIPISSSPVRWGRGPAGGGDIYRVRFNVVRGSGRFHDRDVRWFGAADRLSLEESAYIVFSGTLPEFICFGLASDPSGPPKKMEIYRTALAGFKAPLPACGAGRHPETEGV